MATSVRVNLGTCHTVFTVGRTDAYHLVPSGEGGWGKSAKYSKPCAKAKHGCKQQCMMAHVQRQQLLTSNPFQVNLTYK